VNIEIKKYLLYKLINVYLKQTGGTQKSIGVCSTN
jgi:hypothetical protein